MYGLEECIFCGILDNSPLKQNKRMYGTALTIRSPGDVIGVKATVGDRLRATRVFLNIGAYNEEVALQLHSLDAAVECIFI